MVKESEYVSKFLEQSRNGRYLLEINRSTVTFEDHVEIMTHHFEKNGAFDPVTGKRPEVADDEYGEEAVQGRYDDFFVIPNEQYNRGNDDEREIFDCTQLEKEGLGKRPE